MNVQEGPNPEFQPGCDIDFTKLDVSNGLTLRCMTSTLTHQMSLFPNTNVKDKDSSILTYTALQDKFDKYDVFHNHIEEDVVGLVKDLDTLQEEIDDKADASHTHPDLETAIAGKADVGHKHTKNDITDLGDLDQTYAKVSDLNTKQDTLIAGEGITIQINTISAQQVEIVSNLTDTSDDKALSASMGKKLNDEKADVNHNHDTSYATKTELNSKQNILTAGEGIKIENNTISAEVTDPYVLPKATTDTLGGVMVGDGLSVTEEGVLSVPLASTEKPVS